MEVRYIGFRTRREERGGEPSAVARVVCRTPSPNRDGMEGPYEDAASATPHDDSFVSGSDKEA